MKDFVQVFIEKTMECLIRASNHQDIKFNREMAIDYAKTKLSEKSEQCIQTLRKDVSDAGFGLPLTDKTRLTALQRSVQNVTFIHECTMFAQEILNHSQTPGCSDRI